MKTNYPSSENSIKHIFGIVTDTLEVHLRDQKKLREKLYSDLKRELGVSSEIVRLIEGDVLVFGDRKIDISNQPLMRKLFNKFINSPRGRVGRSELILEVYQRDIHQLSIRRRMCDYHNIVKLVSRARHLGKNFLDNEYEPEWDWFPYDSVTEEWIFFRSRLNPYERL